MKYGTYEHYHKKAELESLKSKPFFLKKNEYHTIKPGMVVQGYRANIQETEREDLKIQVHPVIYNEALSVNKPTNKIPMACLHYPDSTNTIKADGWLSNYTHING